ncbi:cupredoxin family copper-binding protein [Actinacidiphila oryziradicis]|jgi:plastocyanin|uniref:cupredoxin domain-containing protein n=1 Tax=Actinacidiphila oryziradicis TaxID=2571141 RepID=UPI0023EFFD57|nr:cupredoxin family copper-binding protein [Actinacidiphila oryziradicis]MCW2869434.1 plastocyanin [Actinacidiphila oryziradicis]
MYLHFRPPARRSRLVAGLAVAAAGTLGLLSACDGSSHPAATGAGAITPAPGQSLAGTPGAAGAGGAASSAPGASAMPSMSMPMSPPATRAPTAPVAGDAVAIKNFAFSPAVLKVKAGTTVTWTNQDTDAHTVTSTGSGGPLKSAALATRATYRYTFTKPGTYAYLCTIHPFMTATVEVSR